MELKLVTNIANTLFILSSNRTFMELKSIGYHRYKQPFRVLIAPLWN